MSNTRETLFQIAMASKNCIVFEATYKKNIYNLYIIRKMVRRYINKNIINERLLLNNVIIAINVFEFDVLMQLLDLILNDSEMTILKTLLNFIGLIKSDDIDCNLDEILHESMSHIRVIQWS